MKREQMAADEAHRQSLAPPDNRLDQVLQTLMQHHSMLQGLNKPRRAVIHRDPRGKMIGAALVTED